jgi:hypothetical protein
MLPPIPQHANKSNNNNEIASLSLSHRKYYHYYVLFGYIFVIVVIVNNFQSNKLAPSSSSASFLRKSSAFQHLHPSKKNSTIINFNNDIQDVKLEIKILKKNKFELEKILRMFNENIHDKKNADDSGNSKNEEATELLNDNPKLAATLNKYANTNMKTSNNRTVSIKAPIVFCHVGNSIKYGAHVKTAMKQARLFNPFEAIFIISSASTLKNHDFANVIHRLGIIHVPIETLKPNPYLDKFNEYFFIGNNMAVGKNSGNKHFNKYTMERFYHILRFMEIYDVHDIFHLENDNMLFINTAEYVDHVASKCNLEFGLQARELLDTRRPNRQFLIAGTVFIKNANALRKILNYNLNLLQKGKSFLAARLKHSSVNDMTLMAIYYQDHFNKRNGASTAMTILPENPNINDPNDGTWSGSDDKIQHCLLEKGNGMIFDNAAISIWNHGTFHNKKKFHAKTMKQAWYAYSRLDAKLYNLKWETCSNKIKCKCPFLIGKKDQGEGIANRKNRVASLHVHSKQLLTIYQEACKV